MLNPFVLAGIAIALAMDAFAVSIGISTLIRKVSPRQMFRLSFHFGLFQAIMPILGWYTGNQVGDWLLDYDHWIACSILWGIGGKIVYQSFLDKEPSSPENPSTDNNHPLKKDPTRGISLIMLSIATSIDAYAVGLSFAFIGVSIWFPSFWIGITAGFLTLLGMRIGIYVSKKFGKGMELVGAILLFIIGAKILFDHIITQ
ncbi:MAG TPA: manganese efflux pump MntP family protein [Candidatus Hydrogenedens sp.]|nr:manganese efflux pump MntP family protein [Candidatus Hydrogenedens sp.]HOK09397.1 manganese efflux pump MntP family protein [Candidatus Hydrogenedens sp.]HOL19110.1 manganese efflux pump MntP family protein [Candidatus Hydrogenedens sp.]HPP58072.1 manganese efflux pump MntP family protein [Candidatus Hydrogenedens sp.]